MRESYESLENEVKKLRKELLVLRDSEAKFRTAFKSSSDAIAITRISDSKIVEINDGFTELTGYTWPEVAGKITEDINLWVDPEEQRAGVEQLMNTGKIKNLEALFRIKNGQVVHGLISADRMTLNGEPHLISITRNIEDRKRVEENLNIAQEVGKIGSWELDWVTRKLTWSDQLYRIFELNKSDIQPDYELFKSIIHPDDRNKALQVLRRSIRNKTSYFHVHRIVLATGKQRWVEERGRSFYDETGKLLRSVGAVRDITEKKLADDALLKSERLFQSLATSSPVGIFRTDAEGLTTYVNPKWCQLSGLARTDAMGNGWLKAVPPEDRERLGLHWQNSVETKGISTSEYRFLHPDGKVVYVKGQAVPEYDEKDNVTGYVGTITDITEQKLAEIALQKAHGELVDTLENMTDGFTSVDKNWHYLYVNRRAGEIFGRDPAQLIGKKVWDEFPEMLDTVFYTESIKAMKNRKPIAFENYYAPYQQWFENRLVPSREGLSTFFQDITERKTANEQLSELNESLEQKVKKRTEKLERSEQAMLYLLEDMKNTQEKLKQTNKRLQALNSELEAFSYSVSHDLKAPLRAINGFSDFLKEDYYEKLGDDGRHLLDDIMKNATDMGRLIDGLLNLSRTSRKDLQLHEFELKPVAESVFSEQIKYYNMPEAVLKIENNIPALWADYTLVKQLLTNLISNALKYSSHKKKAIIKIGCLHHKSQIIYFIEDNGVGFDNKYATKMFDTFYRLHSRSEYEGTGIGLSIVKRIVNKHGGKVWAEGEVDKGAKIFFTLPSKNHNSHE